MNVERGGREEVGGKKRSEEREKGKCPEDSSAGKCGGRK